MERPTIKGWTIRRRIVASFAVVLGLMIVMGLIAMRDLVTIDRHTTEAATTYVPGLYESANVQEELGLNYALTAEYLAQTDAAGRERVASSLRDHPIRW